MSALPTNTLIYVCWGLWAAVWTAGWILNIVRGPRTQRRSLGWSFWMWVLAFIVFGEGRVRVFTGVLPQSPVLPAVGAILLVAGTAFTLWARWILGAMWSSQPSVKSGHELRTDGPYAITRHPIYTGMCAMILGGALMQGSTWIVLVVLFAIYVALKMREEERLMAATFGDAYARYRITTPQIIPGLRWSAR